MSYATFRPHGTIAASPLSSLRPITAVENTEFVRTIRDDVIFMATPVIEVMFSFNLFWRSETLGSYGLVFNTIMHYRGLSTAGEPPLTDDE